MALKQNLKDKLVESKRFVRFVVDHFIEDDCTYRASALAFTTLLAIVPLMSVGLAILSSFPVFHHLSGPEKDFIFNNFVPATGAVVQNYLELFASQVSKLSIIGIITLFIIALLVMYTVERSMNIIWRVSTPRKGIAAFLLYWAILSLSPFLLGLSLAASSYFFSMPLVRGYESPSVLVVLVPTLLSFMGFTFLYVVVPNCKVRLLHGMYGALFTTLLFELAKQAFVYYLTQYNTYQLLYGAFATIPIFFMWIYWVWLITLLGTEISYAFSVHHQRRQGKKLNGFSHALLWLYHLWLAQREGQGLTLEQLINSSKQPFEVDIGAILKQLSELQLIQITSDGRYILSCDLTQITLYDLTQRLPYPLPNMDDFDGISNCQTPFKLANKQLNKTFAINLHDLFADSDNHHL